MHTGNHLTDYIHCNYYSAAAAPAAAVAATAATTAVAAAATDTARCGLRRTSPGDQ